ncbi:hypothetical protein HYE68_010084 [Fusarium pseudograminearum]|nr:hypothetical protein HYE68_010084 [Fusarium pseudograminearum]
MTSSACQHHASSFLNGPKRLHVHPPYDITATQCRRGHMASCAMSRYGSLKPFYKTSKHA